MKLLDRLHRIAARRRRAQRLALRSEVRALQAATATLRDYDRDADPVGLLHSGVVLRLVGRRGA